MTNEDCKKKLDNLLSDTKSRPFINHLIRSYYNPKVRSVFDTPKNCEKFVCAISGEKLISAKEVLTLMSSEDIKTNLIADLRMELNGGKDKTTLNKLIGDRVMGCRGTNTDTYLSVSTHEYFTFWVQSKIMEGNKHVLWVISGDRKNVNDPKPKTKPKTNLKSSTFTLGDLGKLQELKAKMRGK